MSNWEPWGKGEQMTVRPRLIWYLSQNWQDSPGLRAILFYQGMVRLESPRFHSEADAKAWVAWQDIYEAVPELPRPPRGPTVWERLASEAFDE